MPELNFPNRTLAIMDNIKFLKALNSECIDLIAIDPPFAANETFTGRPKPPITERELAEEQRLAREHGARHNEGIGETRVEDDWRWDKLRHEPWLKEVREDNEEVGALIDAVEMCASENEAAYIAMMASRLLECHRVLKDTGSIYVHCDWHANSYLRMAMDAIFGAQHFRNEVVWRRVLGGKSDAGQYPRSSDRILFYTKGQDFTFHTPRLKDVNDSWYRKNDDKGRYSSQKLTAYGETAGDSGQPWRGKMPTGHWVVPRLLAKRYETETGKTLVGSVRERLDVLADAGYIEFSKSGLPSWRRYLSEVNPPRVADIWIDDEVKPLSRQSSERTGYATQKPLALYQRIVRASSNPGDVVLDLFAGCATTAVAAEKENRRWLACDWAYRSWTMIKRRFYQNGYALSDMTDATPNAYLEAGMKGYQGTLQHAQSHTIGPRELPERDYVEHDEIYDIPNLELRRRRTLQPWQKLKTTEMRRILGEAQALRGDPRAIVCSGCGRVMEPEFMQLDHMLPKKDGGEDFLNNRILMCGPCNHRKKERLTYSGLIAENRAEGWTVDREAADAARKRRDARVDIEIAERS